MREVIVALCREHESIRSVLDVLDSETAYLAEYRGRRRADYRLVWAAIEYMSDFPDLVHHPKEDLVYNRLCAVDPAAAGRVGDIPAAHRVLASDLRALATELAAVMQDPRRPRSALSVVARGFVRHLRHHLDAEEAVFFPVAERTLDAGTWAELKHRAIARLDPLIGGEASERFEALRRTITSASATSGPSLGA